MKETLAHSYRFSFGGKTGYSELLQLLRQHFSLIFFQGKWEPADVPESWSSWASALRAGIISVNMPYIAITLHHCRPLRLTALAKKYRKFTNREAFLGRNTFRTPGDYRTSVAGTVAPVTCTEMFNQLFTWSSVSLSNILIWLPWPYK